MSVTIRIDSSDPDSGVSPNSSFAKEKRQGEIRIAFDRRHFEPPHLDTKLKPGKTATRQWTIGSLGLKRDDGFLRGKIELSGGLETNLVNNERSCGTGK